MYTGAKPVSKWQNVHLKSMTNISDKLPSWLTLILYIDIFNEFTDID